MQLSATYGEPLLRESLQIRFGFTAPSTEPSISGASLAKAHLCLANLPHYDEDEESKESGLYLELPEDRNHIVDAQVFEKQRKA
jgi:hypothetical protein